MSAPSALHEDRVDLLGDLAHLAGYTVLVDLYDTLRPDVCRLHRTARSLWIGDAKATEHPGDAATRARLSRYVAAAEGWLTLGFNVTLVLCHGPDPAGAWSQTAQSVIQAAGYGVGESRYSPLDVDTVLTAVQIVKRHPSV